MHKPDDRAHAPGSVLGSQPSTHHPTDRSVADVVGELRGMLFDQGSAQRAHFDDLLLGKLCAQLEAILDVNANRFSRVRQRLAIELVGHHPALRPEHLAGGTFVDLGCGGLNPLSSLMVLKAAGAARCIGIDLDPLEETLAVRDAAATALELIGEPKLYFFLPQLDGEQVRRNLAGLDIRAMLRGPLAGKLAAMGSFPIEYRQRAADVTGIEGASVACVMSESFLEHVPDPDAVLAEMARISKPGAVGVHGIDGADHRSYATSTIGCLDFLGVASDDALVFNSNRIRPLDYIAMFERHGFEVCRCDTYRSEEVTPAQRAAMVEPFRSMPLERLGVIGARLFVQRR